MSLPSVAALCADLGADLTPAEGFRAPEVEITAVHISELRDPNAYLAGGELLMTTGLALPTNEIGCRSYVSRLLKAEVSALAFGLGPVHQELPDRLVRACRKAGLPLLVVPAPTPFLTISRAYWAARSRSSEQELSDAVAGHRALVDAAVAPDPSAAILRRLARLLDGWAALLDEVGDVTQVYPLSASGGGGELQAEVKRLSVAGVHSSASFTLHGHVVAVFPLAVEDQVVGYLAAGTPDQLKPWERRMILTAAALLSLDVVREQRSQSAREAARRCLALLVDLGFVDAARRLAPEVGGPAPGREVVVMAARGRDSEDLTRVVERWCPEVLSVGVNRAEAWFLVPDDHDGISELVGALRQADEGVTLVVSDLVAAEMVGSVRARVRRTLHRLPPGTLDLPEAAGTLEVARAVDAFARRASVDLQQALVAFLRHRGQWEPASRALGLHRNTLRYRVARALEVLDLNLDDPDIAAQAWLTFRSRGLG